MQVLLLDARLLAGAQQAHQIQHNHRAWGIRRRHRRSGLRSGAPCTKKQQNRHDRRDHSFCAPHSQRRHVVLCVNDDNLAGTTVVMMIDDDSRRVLYELAALVVLVLL